MVGLGGGWMSGIKEWLTHWSQVIRGALIGIRAGVLPGVGATAGTWLAYGQAVATAKDKRNFGKGDPRGIVGPESSNNSVEAGDLIPTLLFGIPGGVPSAMLLGMLLTYGIQPGPAIVTEHLNLMYLIVWCFAIASILGAFLCFLATPSPAKLTKVPFAVLGAGLLVIMLLGAFQEGGQIGDLWIMIILGAVGWLMKATDTPRAPFLIGFVLAIPMERYYYLTDSLYDGLGWLTRPGVLVFLAVLIAPALWALVKRTRKSAPDLGHRGEEDLSHGEEDETEDGQLKDSIWSLGLALGVTLIFGTALAVSQSFSAEAQLMPRLVSMGGLITGLILLWKELRARRSIGDGPGWTHDVTIAMRMFAAMALFLVLVMLGGYLLAVALFVPAFLLFVARATPRTTIIYTLVLCAVLLTLPSILPVDLPTGLLQS